MPRLPQEIFRAPFYLYETEEEAQAGAPFGGTGFIVAYPTDLPDVNFVYAVTNWHVAVRDGASVIRVNKIGGGMDIFPLDPAEWHFQRGGYDLAIASFPLTVEKHECNALCVTMFLSKEEIEDLGITPGEDIFMVGRFVDHDGADSNVPAVRFGNISVMPQKIVQPTGATHLESFILDLHSRTGYSGSPVFVYRTVGSDLTIGSMSDVPKDIFLKFLGIHWGQFPEKWEIETGVKNTAQGVTYSEDEKYIKGLSGMTMAVPAWAIKEFLDMPQFRDGREMALAKIKRERGIGSFPMAESLPTPKDADANPSHKEDFSRLLSAAARKRTQGD
jgi:hypothetical protein